MLFLPFRAFCVGDLSQIDDVRPLSSVCPCLSRSSSAMMHQSPIIIADYDHETAISQDFVKKCVFSLFLWVVGTVVSSYMLSCDLLEKDM